MNYNKICCICIPIYKRVILETELISLKQCFKILNGFDTFFITHKKLDHSQYDEICSKYNSKIKYKYFPDKYFRNINGYNSLLLKKEFYFSFLEYKYILIYQLDAFIFSNQLIDWCQKEYNYIGAPWLTIQGSCCSPVFSDISIGNGGFSLRNVLIFYNLISIKIKFLYMINMIISFYLIVKKYSSSFPLLNLIRFPLLVIGKIFGKLVSMPNNTDFNEDVIWSIVFSKIGGIPKPLEAMKFSFEHYPEYLFELNNNNLPFGCHNWERYYNYLFWKKFIPYNMSGRA
jgi:hypothetical protein